MKEQLQNVIKVFSEFVSWPEYDIIPIVLGTCIANLGDGDAVFLLLVGPPSSGKTELIRGFYGLPGFYELSKVTEHTFISGFIEKGKKKGSDNSLLVRLTKDNKRVVMIKDLTTLLTMNPNVRTGVFSQLREIADGYCSTPFGTGEDVRWKGKLGFIAGVTGAIDESFSMRQSLGERFLQVKIGRINQQKAAEKAAMYSGMEEAFRDSINKEIGAFMEAVDTEAIPLIETEPEAEEKICSAARFLSMARTGVSRDRMTKILLALPETEGSARIIRQLTHMGRGICLCFDKSAINQEIYKFIRRVVRDSIPAIREQCIYRMWKDELNGGSKQTTSALSESLNHSKAAIWTWLEDLKDVGLITKTMQGKEALWSLSAEGFELIQHAEVFGSEEMVEAVEEEVDPLIYY